MKFAQGSILWIVVPILLAVFFLFLSFFSKDIISSIALFIMIVLWLLTVVFLLFFRDPDRKIGKGLVSAADGRIREISSFIDKDVGKCIKVSIFMNLYNVHVNRMPIEGIIKNIIHVNGSYLPAFKKESEKNERLIFTVNTNIGLIKIVQIAGILARRIVKYVKAGNKLKKGDRIGMIRFGSRVDLYLPSEKIKLCIKVGDIVKAGEDKIAEINA